jgi:hypothetical protein
VRRSVIGVLIGAICCLLLAAQPCCAQTAPAGREAQTTSATAGNLITHVSAVEGQALLITVIDVKQQVMAIYQIDGKSGEITLKSVRNIGWDLQMINFNTGKPLPQDVRSGLPK